MINLFKHLKTITYHKLLVGELCFKIHLYKQGVCHDLSKYSWTELKTGLKYYQGNCSPNGYERKVKGYSLAWLHHKGRNKHHWEFWIDFTHQGIIPVEMPYCYVLEMFCDRVAASKVYKGKNYEDTYPLEYYQLGEKNYILHQNTRFVLEYLLTYLSQHGLNETMKYINTHTYEDILGEKNGTTTKSNCSSGNCITQKK